MWATFTTIFGQIFLLVDYYNLPKMEKENSIDKQSCLSQLQTEFSLFSSRRSAFIDHTQIKSKIQSSNLLSIDQQPQPKKTTKKGFDSLTKRFLLPILPTEYVGPGSYNTSQLDLSYEPDNPIQRRMAPFNTTSSKKAQLSYKTGVPGPGAYELRRSAMDEIADGTGFKNPYQQITRLRPRDIGKIGNNTLLPGPGDYELGYIDKEGPTYRRLFTGPPKFTEAYIPCSAQIDYPPSTNYTQKKKKIEPITQKTSSRMQLKSAVQNFLGDLYDKPDLSKLESCNAAPNPFHKHTNAFIPKTPNPYTSYIPFIESPYPSPTDYTLPSTLTVNKKPQQLSVFRSKVQRRLFTKASTPLEPIQQTSECVPVGTPVKRVAIIYDS